MAPLRRVLFRKLLRVRRTPLLNIVAAVWKDTPWGIALCTIAGRSGESRVADEGGALQRVAPRQFFRGSDSLNKRRNAIADSPG